MSCIILSNQSGIEVPIGTLIVVDNNEARAYNDEKDTIEDVIGVIYPTSLTSGRAYRVPDGPEYYLNDPVLWQENLQFEIDENENSVPNESFTPWNPFTNTNNWCLVIYNGFAAILNSYSSVPSRWKLLRTGTSYNWYLIR